MTIDDVITGVLKREGGTFTNDAQDAPTKWGVTLAALQEFEPAATIAELQAMDDGAARTFYRWRFAPFMALDVEWRVWVNVLDAVTLHGPTGAVKAIQTALGLVVDGHLGPKTLAAIHATAAEVFCLAFARARLAICVGDIRRDLTAKYGEAAVEETDVKYLGGWCNRILTVAFGPDGFARA